DVADGGGQSGKRDRAPRSKAVHQHLPAVTRAGHAADDVVHGDEYVSPPVRTVHECGVERQMPASDVDAWRLRGNQRKRDADVVAASQQMLRIVETEGEPEQRRDRPERGIAL